MTDIGDVETVTTTIEVAGALTDPDTVVITVTAPDGTASTPAVTNPSAGTYQALVPATSAGRWRYTWTTTGPAGVQHGHFDIRADPPPPGRLDPLASISDLEDRIGTLTDDQAQKAPALLRDASAAVRGYCRQNFDLTENDTVILRPVGAELILPQRPALAVHSVAAISGDGQPDIVMSGWEWDGLDRIKIGGFGWRTAIDYDLEWDWVGWSPETYRVVYDHGYATTPDDVVGVVCGMVNRILVAPSMIAGLTGDREQVGPFSRDYRYDAAGSPGPKPRLTQEDKDDLANAGYRRRSGTIQVRA